MCPDPRPLPPPPPTQPRPHWRAAARCVPPPRQHHARAGVLPHGPRGELSASRRAHGASRCQPIRSCARRLAAPHRTATLVRRCPPSILAVGAGQSVPPVQGRGSVWLFAIRPEGGRRFAPTPTTLPIVARQKIIDTRRQRLPLGEADIKSYMQMMLRGIEHMHARSILHRVSPCNACALVW